MIPSGLGNDRPMGPTVVSPDREIGIPAVTALDEDPVGRIAGWPADRPTRVERRDEDDVPDAAELRWGSRAGGVLPGADRTRSVSLTCALR